MSECDICGKLAEDLTVFVDLVHFSLCSMHRNIYDSIVKKKDSSPEIQSFLGRLTRNHFEFKALEIVYTGRGPEALRELTEKFLELNKEKCELREHAVFLHNEVIDEIVSNKGNKLPPPHSLLDDHIEDH